MPPSGGVGCLIVPVLVILAAIDDHYLDPLFQLGVAK